MKTDGQRHGCLLLCRQCGSGQCGGCFNVECETGAGQGDPQLQVVGAAESGGQFGQFFAANSAVAVDQFAPREAADGGRHDAGGLFKAEDGFFDLPGGFESNSEQQLAGAFKRAGIRDAVQFGDCFGRQIQVQKSVGSEQSTDSFWGES